MRRALMVLLALLALPLAACGPTNAEQKTADPQAEIAAALDPCRNEGPISRTLCGNERLAALEARLREAVVREAGEVSDAGRQTMIQNHQRWLLAQRTICGMVDPEAAPDANEASCLEAALNDRLRQTQSAVETEGGYTFQRMEIIASDAVSAEAAAASNLGDQAPAAITRDIRFPRIDNASTPQAARFNALVAQQPQFRIEDQTEETVNYEIAFAGPELISVRFDTFNATLGAMHPSISFRAVNVVMTTGEPLVAANVFRAGSGWENFLTRRGIDGLTPLFRTNGGAPRRDEVRDNVTKPQFWLIRESGLTLLFPPYSISGPLGDGAEVVIPWRDLAPYLSPEAPAPIRAPV